jgi:hypothetical protein
MGEVDRRDNGRDNGRVDGGGFIVEARDFVLRYELSECLVSKVVLNSY